MLKSTKLPNWLIDLEYLQEDLPKLISSRKKGSDRNSNTELVIGRLS